MKKSTIVGGVAFAAVVLAIALAPDRRERAPAAEPAEAAEPAPPLAADGAPAGPPAASASTSAPASPASSTLGPPTLPTAPAGAPAEPQVGQAMAVGQEHPGFLYGRVTAEAGATYEGRLRFGGTQEAFWGDFFNGAKVDNPWVAYVPAERLPKEPEVFAVFGLEILRRERPVDLGRPFLARLGDLASLEAVGRTVVATMRSGTVFELARFEASDFDDGLRIWDPERGVVDLDSLRVRKIEFLPTPWTGAAPSRLYGTVRTRLGDFTGFVQWNREAGVGVDELVGERAGREHRLRFDTIRAIARRSADSSVVTLLDGRELELSGVGQVGDGNSRGLYIEDPRYGRVLVSWHAVERLDFADGGSGPAYGDFPPGSPLSGSVTTRDGHRLAGRLVFDLDESETTETLDAPALAEGAGAVNYTLPFGLVASIVLPSLEEADASDAAAVTVTLTNGEVLTLARVGDLGERNAGLLVFVDGGPQPEYVPWPEVARIDLDPPVEMYPHLGAGAGAGDE